MGRQFIDDQRDIIPITSVIGNSCGATGSGKVGTDGIAILKSCKAALNLVCAIIIDDQIFATSCRSKIAEDQVECRVAEIDGAGHVRLVVARAGCATGDIHNVGAAERQCQVCGAEDPGAVTRRQGGARGNCH